MSPLVVAVAQIASVPGDVGANRRKHVDVIAAARSAGVDVLVFPELSLTGHYGGRDALHVALRRDDALLVEIAAASGPMLTVVGFVEEGAAAQFYNAAAAFRDGALVAVHRKINLATYGRLDDGKHFAAGARVHTFDVTRVGPPQASDQPPGGQRAERAWGETVTRVGPPQASDQPPGGQRAERAWGDVPSGDNWRASVMICADLWNPALVHLAAVQHATLLLAPVSSAREAVGDGFDNPGGWDVNVRFHALTYGLPIAMANRVGREDDLTFFGGSRIVDPFGRTLAQVESEREGFVHARLDFADVRRARYRLPTVRDANLPLVAREIARILGGYVA